MKARLVSENINFERGRDPRDAMNIGLPRAQAERKLRAFADKMGWEFWETPRGIWTLTTPLDLEVAHNMESTGGYKGTYDYGSFQADSLRYKVSWQEGSWGTLISLRKVYMQNGKEVKQNKMDEFPEIEDVIKRIELNYPKELRKAGITESLDFERGRDPKESMGIGNKEAQAIKKIGKHAEARGFREAEIGPQHEEEGIINIKRWLYHSDMTDDDIEVVLYKEEDYPDDLMVYVGGPNGDYQDSAEDWFNEITWDANLWEADDEVNEQVRFNFDKNPTDKYRVKPGVSRPPVENPRKRQYGLTSEEEEIVQRHQKRIDELQERIEDLENDIQEYKYEIEKLEDYGPDPAEAEQFDSDIIQRFGWNALDLLNSGSPKDEKIKGLDRLDPKNDSGLQDFESIIRDYDYYHPPEPDNDEEIEGFQRQIDIRNEEISKIEDQIERLLTKIHNLETY